MSAVFRRVLVWRNVWAFLCWHSMKWKTPLRIVLVSFHRWGWVVQKKGVQKKKILIMRNGNGMTLNEFSSVLSCHTIAYVENSHRKNSYTKKVTSERFSVCIIEVEWEIRALTQPRTTRRDRENHYRVIALRPKTKMCIFFCKHLVKVNDELSSLIFSSFLFPLHLFALCVLSSCCVTTFFRPHRACVLRPFTSADRRTKWSH